MERNLKKELIAWKQDSDRAPLIVRGARQVGKTYLICEFGKAEFSSFLKVDFEQTPQAKHCFLKQNPLEIKEQLELFFQEEITVGKTLLFLDEIQECPEALKALRYFKEQMGGLHIIAAGSLLDFTLSEEEFSFPVGRVQFMYLKPFSFDEFMVACGNTKWLEMMESASLKNPIPEHIHHELLKCVSNYFLLGGMPAVIRSYLQNQSFLKCLRLQSAIITAYYEDFGKYAKKTDVSALRLLYEKAPEFISKYVKYSKIDRSVNRPEVVYKAALLDLSRAGLIYQVFASAGNGLPLRAQKNEKKFKLLFLDIGLLQNTMGVDPQEIKAENLMQLNSGSLAEQFAGQELLANIDPYLLRSIYFWEREKKGSEAEVDFLFGIHGSVVPIEVKAGGTGKLRSINQFMAEKGTPVGVRISQRPLSFERQILSVPLYMIKQLPRLLKEI